MMKVFLVAAYDVRYHNLEVFTVEISVDATS